MKIDANLRLRHVRTFLEIARAESVSVAAGELNVTQPAVSRSLRELEEMLGQPLFDRVGRGLRLNAAGRVFQSHASASMSELIRGQDRLARQTGVQDRVSVGVLPTAATDLVPRAALAFARQMPNARTHILTGPNWLLFNQLRDGALDLVVGRMPEHERSDGLTFKQLYIEDVVLLCRPGHPLLRHPDPEKAIADYPVILPPKGAVIARTVERFLNSIGVPELQPVFETVSLPVGRKILELSDMLWFISRSVVADELTRGVLARVQLGSPVLSGPVGTSVSRSAPVNAVRDVFSECLQDVAKSARGGSDAGHVDFSR